MRAEIRAILDGKKPAMPPIGRKRIRVMEAKAAVTPKRHKRPRNIVSTVVRVEVKKLVKRVSVPSTWILDHQTPEELRERELEAELKAQKTAAAILLRRLVNAHPTGERCVQRACPYPAVLDGQCRRHVTDRTQVSSLLQSQLGKGAVFLT